MMVEIGQVTHHRRIIGSCQTSSEALPLATETLQSLTMVPGVNPDQWIEIFDGDLLRMSTPVDANRQTRV